jgi:hypothetical protein
MDSPHVSIMQQGQVLLLKNVRKLDRGMYQCVARSNDESAQGSAELTLGGELASTVFFIMATELSISEISSKLLNTK